MQFVFKQCLHPCAACHQSVSQVGKPFFVFVEPQLVRAQFLVDAGDLAFQRNGQLNLPLLLLPRFLSRLAKTL
ncbi:MAG: hypothetical protein ACLUI3_00120 [Christensenellales bacterium]